MTPKHSRIQSAEVESASRRLRATCCFVALLACVFLSGCRALNENPRNERFWFPTILPPSRAEREARATTFPDGGDPYLDAQVGPRSFDTRPRGWDMSRSRTSYSLGVLPTDDEE